MAKKIKEKFSDSLIIIDEVHNIRTQTIVLMRK